LFLQSIDGSSAQGRTETILRPRQASTFTHPLQVALQLALKVAALFLAFCALWRLRPRRLPSRRSRRAVPSSTYTSDWIYEAHRTTL